MFVRCMKSCFTLDKLYKEGRDYELDESTTKRLYQNGAICFFRNLKKEQEIKEKAAKSIANAKKRVWK